MPSGRHSTVAVSNNMTHGTSSTTRAATTDMTVMMDTMATTKTLIMMIAMVVMEALSAINGLAEVVGMNNKEATRKSNTQEILGENTHPLAIRADKAAAQGRTGLDHHRRRVIQVMVGEDLRG
jgi:nucleoside recognition membrane protein YjiH